MNTEPNIVITGFMGTGKSTVAEIVARKLNRPFVDMDLEIETRAGFSIHADIPAARRGGLPRHWNGSSCMSWRCATAWSSPPAAARW